MKKITSIYKKSINENLKEINFILRKLKINDQNIFLSCERFLNLSADNIINKWLSGTKYCRTYFVQKAFGKIYPTKYLQLSLSIDAMVNILDDLLDELLDKKEKSKYVIEFLRIFSIYNKEHPSKIISELFFEYLNKLIALAIAEDFYQKMISREENIDKIITSSVDLLICRGMDIDIFNKIALLENKGIKKKKVVEDMGRIFRAVNILKKDIKDIEHDEKNNIKTMITLVRSRRDINFLFYITGILDLFTKKVNLILNRVNLDLDKDNPQFMPIYNFSEMIKEDQKEIQKFLNNNY